ncbi:Uncharacterised protein [Raoultella terrigena]|uniref:Uncharacterized protein n=1 Tax=Raoultella terrigena TaxID=577 RepID=A0A4U9D5Y8_RAOTE|nr:Uncharacterised protein [Raoultella terrigena]
MNMQNTNLVSSTLDFLNLESLSEKTNGRVFKHIFLELYCGKLYRKNFSDCERILIRDGFKKRKNADYPPIEEFSDLHITYGEEGMDGFGDFLIVGDGLHRRRWSSICSSNTSHVLRI